MNDENQQPDMEEIEGEEMAEQLDGLFIGTKIITARSMDECTFLREYKGQDTQDRETGAGYVVTYPDGYISWSPKNVFETAYREITFGELALMK